jgi:hypothetical protein
VGLQVRCFASSVDGVAPSSRTGRHATRQIPAHYAAIPYKFTVQTQKSTTTTIIRVSIHIGPQAAGLGSGLWGATQTSRRLTATPEGDKPKGV